MLQETRGWGGRGARHDGGPGDPGFCAFPMPCRSSNAIAGARGHAALPRLAGDIAALFKQEEGSFLSYPVPWEHAVH